MQDQCAVCGVANRPGICRRDGCDSIEDVISFSAIGTGRNTPTGVIEPLNQCLFRQGTLRGTLQVVADRPYYMRRNGCDGLQCIASGGSIGTGKHTPTTSSSVCHAGSERIVTIKRAAISSPDALIRCRTLVVIFNPCAAAY